MKKFLFLLIFISFMVSACSSGTSAPDSLAEAKAEIQNHVKKAQVPMVEGLEIQEIDILLDPMANGESTLSRDSVIIAYANEKGRLQQMDDAKTADKVTVYGPYVGGDKIITFSQSEWEVSFDDPLEEKTVNGISVQYKKINEDHLYIYASHNGLSLTYEGFLSGPYDEDRHFEIFEHDVLGNH